MVGFRMAEESIEVNEEEIISHIYVSCEKTESGLVKTSALIKVIETASNKTDDAEVCLLFCFGSLNLTSLAYCPLCNS